MRHIPEEFLVELATRRGGASDFSTRHLLVCAQCRRVLELHAELAAALLVTPRGACPDDGDLVRFADTGASRTGSIGVHLAKCHDCSTKVERLASMREAAAPLPVALRPDPPARPFLDRLRELVTFEYPLALTVTTRGGAAASRPADSQVASFQRGMEAYRSGNYALAIERLQAARAAGDRTPGLTHYLGACQLAEHNFELAEETLAAAVQERRRSSEFRFYHAQALLGVGRAEDALKELARGASLGGPYATRSQNLADRLKALLQDHGASLHRKV